VDLGDVPDSYTSKGTFLVRIKSTTDGVEFVDPATVIHISSFVSEGTTTHTLAASEMGKVIRFSNVSDSICNVPTTGTIPVGAQFHIRQAGAGKVEFVPASGVTINSPQSLFTAGQHATVTLLKVASLEWDIFGALQPL